MWLKSNMGKTKKLLSTYIKKPSFLAKRSVVGSTDKSETSIDINKGLNKLKINTFLHDQIKKARTTDGSLEENTKYKTSSEDYKWKNPALSGLAFAFTREVEHLQEDIYKVFCIMDQLETYNLPSVNKDYDYHMKEHYNDYDALENITLQDHTLSVASVVLATCGEKQTAPLLKAKLLFMALIHDLGKIPIVEENYKREMPENTAHKALNRFTKNQDELQSIYALPPENHAVWGARLIEHAFSPDKSINYLDIKSVTDELKLHHTATKREIEESVMLKELQKADMQVRKDEILRLRAEPSTQTELSDNKERDNSDS